MKQADIKIVKLNKVKKLPRERKTVKAALLRALDDAQKQKWVNVVVIGQSSDGIARGCTLKHTEMLNYELLGLIEQGKSII